MREYPDAGHGFLNRHKPLRIARIIAKAGFRQEAADDAWDRIDAFFATHLHQTSGQLPSAEALRC